MVNCNLLGVTDSKVYKWGLCLKGMVEQYTQEEFEEFAKGIKKASDILRSKKPDYILAPVVGAVPFVDLFYIADRHFNLDAVEYPPNSSRFLNRRELMST